MPQWRMNSSPFLFFNSSSFDGRCSTPKCQAAAKSKAETFPGVGKQPGCAEVALRCHPHHWSQRVQKCPSRPPRDSSLSCDAAATLEPSDCKKKGRLQVQWANFPLRTPPKMYFQQKQASLPGLGSYQTPAKTPPEGFVARGPCTGDSPTGRAGFGGDVAQVLMFTVALGLLGLCSDAAQGGHLGKNNSKNGS